MTRTYTDTEQRNLDVVKQFFGEIDGPKDKSLLFAEDGAWWNGLPLIPGAEGQTEHRGRDAIRNILPSQTKSPRVPGGDRYDLSTMQATEVLVMVDGDLVMRQQNFSATTLRGQHYENTYCFVFQFNNAGEITYLTEHWNTFHAHNVLFGNFEVAPANPMGGPQSG
jgi:ketosteroid isomerase-like protein